MTTLSDIKRRGIEGWGKRTGERVISHQEAIDELSVKEARVILAEIKAERDNAARDERVNALIESEINGALGYVPPTDRVSFESNGEMREAEAFEVKKLHEGIVIPADMLRGWARRLKAASNPYVIANEIEDFVIDTVGE